jgi:hypothetical protein
MARQIVVEVVGDASKFSKATDDATKKAGGLNSVLSGVGAGVALGAFNLAAGAVGSFVGALDEAQKAYQADQASQVLLANTLKNTVPGWDGSTKAIEDYAAAQIELGFADDEIRASIGQLIGITHDETKAMELNTLAQDLARAKGIDLATATDIVTKAAQGNGRALKALGVDVGGATDAAGMLDAIQKNVTGSAEAWAETSEGQTAVAQAKQGEAWEKIGRVVDRIAMAVLPAVTAALTIVADVIDEVFTALEPLIEDLLTELGPIFEQIGKIAAKVFPYVVGFMKTFIGVWIEIFKIAGNVIGTFVKVIEDVATTVGEIFGAVGAIVKGAINGIISIINGIIQGINSFKIPKIEIAGNVIFGGWGGLGLGRIPYLHAGGIVPGVPGSEQLALLQAGERVLPRNQSAAGITINVYGDTYGDGIDRLSEKLALRMRLQGA